MEEQMNTQNNLAVHEREAEKPKKNVLFAYMGMLILILTVFLVHCVIDMNASDKAAEYGLTHDDLRTEYSLILFYLFAASVLSVIIIRGLRFVSVPLRLVACALIFGAASYLSSQQLAISKELAPIKKEFALATNKCHVVARGELDCGEYVRNAIKRRDMALEALDASILGEWRVSAPKPQTRVIDMAAAYLPF
jgi:hypothetical protein